MTFISYAQNFEDVTLWRALQLFGPGFYIDIGANHPVRDSVTKSLYERGWRGINIEPVLHYHESLCRERSEDVNLCIAVGDEENELVFYESPETGLSTLSLDMAVKQKAEGISFIQRTVKTRTLTSICEEFVHSELPLQFLKIDVEGFEEQVLRGMDLKRWRPWIILVESAYDSEPAWASLILDAGYQFALCDGINRYYVAEEMLELLLVPLAMPPNIMDDFRLCEGHFLSSPVADIKALEASLSMAVKRAETAEMELKSIYSSRAWRFAKTVTAIRQRIYSKMAR